MSNYIRMCRCGKPINYASKQSMNVGITLNTCCQSCANTGRIVSKEQSKYHKRQKQKDLIRQNKIIDILKPNKFWRYNAINKQCKNVLGE